MTAETDKPRMAPPKARAPRRKPVVVEAPARPGSIEEIERGPSGKSIAAVFDFDGTLIAGYSALDVAQARLMRGQVSGSELLGLVSLAIQGLAGRADFKDLIAFLGKQWKGRNEAELMKEGEPRHGRCQRAGARRRRLLGVPQAEVQRHGRDPRRARRRSLLPAAARTARGRGSASGGELALRNSKRAWDVSPTVT